ncbi:MAG: methionyl-tRNA formyltransferase [Thermovirgaceae bacterium]
MTLEGPLWFAGSGWFAARCLVALAEKRPFSRVITARPRPAGRGLAERETPVDGTASKLGIPVFRTSDINRDETILASFLEEKPFCFFVIDFSQLIGELFLSMPEPGCLNIHPSLLPAYRGAAPIQRAIMNGEKETGVTVFRLVSEMDAGPILLSSKAKIDDEDTFGDMAETLAVEGSDIALEGLELFRKGRISFREQPHEKATFAPKISKRETEIRWDISSREVHDLVRSLNPYPGSHFIFRGKRTKLWRTRRGSKEGFPGEVVDFVDGNPLVACGKGSVELVEVQAEGRRRTDGASWSRGRNFRKGDRLK